MRRKVRVAISTKQILDVLRGLDFAEVVDGVLAKLADQGITEWKYQADNGPFIDEHGKTILAVIQFYVGVQLGFFPPYDEVVQKELLILYRRIRNLGYFKHVFSTVTIGALGRLWGLDRSAASEVMQKSLAEFLSGVN